MEEQVKYKAKKAKKEKKEVLYEYFICYVDRSNKFENALVDMQYLINTKERAYAVQRDLRRVTNDNFRAIVNYQLLRKKFKNNDN